MYCLTNKITDGELSEAISVPDEYIDPTLALKEASSIRLLPLVVFPVRENVFSLRRIIAQLKSL